MADNADAVLALERRFWTEADNLELFRDSFADDGIFAAEPMEFIGKEQAMKMTADEPWQDVEMTDLHLVELTPDVVVLAYHGQGQARRRRGAVPRNVASTYVRRHGRVPSRTSQRNNG